MFRFDSLREILSTIGKNKLRTCLTGFAVAWGIFMLIILLAAGNGLKNGVISNFAGRAQNTITLWPGWTSMPYKGLPTAREIKFDIKDYNLIRNNTPHVEYVSVRLSQSVTLSYGQEYGSWDLLGVSQDAAKISNIKVENNNGRFLNRIDIDNRRKVIVISQDIKKILFKDQDPIGKHIIANNISYQVIGVYDKKGRYENSPPAYIPFTTAQTLYNKGWGFQNIEFTVVGLKTLKQNEDFIDQLRITMGGLHFFNPEDRSALSVRNMAEIVEQTNDTFETINVFIFIIGICSLMAGVVGVGNIMLITVKERTREIGIRKAIGATPASVLRLIIGESIFITSLSGYIGMFLGIGLVEFINNIMSKMQLDNGPSVFRNPSVDLLTILWATLILILAGVIAGLIPALRATQVRPIEAMRAE